MDLIYKASWLKPDFDCDTSACEFTREFPVGKKLRRATLWVSALGVYSARVNGERVSYVLAPGWTSYSKRVQYQTYDVTSLLGKQNLLSITVAAGWRMKYSVSQNKAVESYGTAEIAPTEYAVIAALRLLYEDGTSEEIYTDKNWHMRDTMWRSSCIYNGDVFDSTFVPSEKPFRVIRHPKSVLIPQEGETVGEHERFKPCQVIHTPKGETVLDFGQNMTGYLEINVHLPRGTRAVIHHAEVLDYEGNFYTENYRSAKAEIVLVGNGTSFLWKPEFTFYGFRYIRLTEGADEFRPDDFTAVVVHSDMERTGHFECSDAKINQLYHNIIWGQKSNFLDVPTDCPQRDERLGWTGDAQVFARCACYNFNADRFFRKWLGDMALDQRPSGSVTHIIPNLDWASPSCGWSDACTIVPWQLYLLYGDREVLRRQFVTVKRWIDYMKEQGDAYINLDKHYGDWLAQDIATENCRGGTDKAYLAYAFRAYSTSLFLKMSDILGIQPEEQQAYIDFLAETKKAIRDTYFADNALTIHTQTALVIALQFGLCPEGTEAAHAARLAEMIHENGDRLTTGFLGTPYLLHVLTDNGYADVAYTLLFQNKMPSWLFSVDHGATTMWEHWDGLRDDGTMWSKSMNSFNHYAYGAVGDWLYGTAAGIETDEQKPGFEHILFRPVPTEKLDFVKASVETKYGTVGAAWRHVGEKIEYTFLVPGGTTATATLDGKTYELDEGEHVITL